MGSLSFAPDHAAGTHPANSRPPAGAVAAGSCVSLQDDAWNRMVAVERAYSDGSDEDGDGDTVTADPEIGSQIAIIKYDGLARRIVKDVDNSGDWDNEYHYYYSGRQMIETRNGSSQTLTQHLWGLMYVDELLQIAINGDPAADNDCLETGASDVSYYVLQGANYNVLAIVESDGDLAERYEYTPYGQRTVFRSPGSDDALCHAPALESQRVTADSATAAYGLCDIGHQGLMHDKEFGLINNRRRYLHPRLGRFLDPKPASSEQFF